MNTISESIKGQTGWQNTPAGLKQYLKAGITTNWDADMQRDMLKSLKSDGLDLYSLNDKDAANSVSKWLLDRGNYKYMFGTYFVHFPNGKPAILPGLENAFKNEKGNTDLPLKEHFQHELFGKGMFYNKSYGTCTSTAIYLTTGLRAIGIPTGAT